jgi:hypothetical protein
MFCNEINKYIFYFIVKLKFSVNMEEFEYLYKIDNDSRVLLKLIE